MQSSLNAFEVHLQRIALASMGYPILRLRKDKTPAETKGWVGDVVHRDIAYWSHPSAYPTDDALNTGIVLRNGVLAVDIDIDHDVRQVDSVIQLAMAFLGQTGSIRRRNGSTRAMLFYRVSDYGNGQRYKEVKNSKAGAVELRIGDSKYAVVYGQHRDGGCYYWDEELKSTPLTSLISVSYEEVKEFREHLAELLGEVEETRPEHSRVLLDSNAVPQRERSYAQEALASECAKLARMNAGSHRNNALNVAAHSLGTMTVLHWIDAKSVARALLEAAVKNGYVSKRGTKAARDTIMSGLNAGALKPRAPLAHDDGDLMDLSALEAGNGGVQAMLATLQQAREPRVSALKPPLEARVAAERSVILTGLASVQEVPIQWHWPGYLPAGMLTLLSGAGGTGKSTLAFGFAATITTGGLWPDGKRCARAGNVLIWSSEDDVARTIKPRLMAAGADISRVGVIEGTTDSDGLRLAFDPARDMDDLRTAVRAIGGIALLIIDPIVSAVSGDMHKANDVRRSLQPIVDFAAEFGCAVLGITHFAKNTGGRNASERVIGSQAFAALARMVLVTAKEEDSDRRVFTRAKSNISADDGGFYYGVEEVTLPNSLIQATRMVWGEAIQGNARSILASVEGQDIERKPINRVEEAVHFLRTELADGPIAARELIDRAKRNSGINERSLQRAREQLGIVAIKAGYQGAWVWAYRLNPAAP